MTEITITTGKFLRALNSVDALVDTAPVTFNEDELRVETVDASNVGAVTMSLQSNAFEHYETDGLEVHLDITQLTQILTRFDNDKQATLKYKSQKNRLILNIESFEFELTTIHPESVRSGRKAGEVEPPAKVVIQASEIQKAIRLADMFSEELIVGIDSKRSVFYLNSIGDSDKMSVSFSETDEVVTRIDSIKAHSIFSLTYLAKMTKFVPKSSQLTIQLGEEYPAKLNFDIAGGDGKIIYGIAPRIV